MDEITKPAATPKSRTSVPPAQPVPPKPAPAEAAGKNGHGAEGLSPAAMEALADIMVRAGRLIRLQAERAQSDDGYQVIDPRTVAATVQESAKTAHFDVARLMGEQMRLWADLGLLWQQTATRIFTNGRADPVISPGPQDKRFKNEAWTNHWYYDYVKQFYLLMARFLEASTGTVEGVEPHTHHKLKFYTRQFVNAVSPTNFAATNPAVVNAAVESRGETLIKG